MAVHYRKGNSSLCKTRSGLRTSDIWRVTCKKCIDLLGEVRRRDDDKMV